MFEIAQIADHKHSWEKVISTYERYRKKYDFDYILEYKLGTLYDHAALQQEQGTSSSKRYIYRAKQAYLRATEKKPDHPLPYLGLARCSSISGDHQEAVVRAKEAYKRAEQQPDSKRGALGIGQFYEKLGDYQQAEEWYQQEMRDLGKDDLGANANLMLFYHRHGHNEKAKPLAKRVKRLLEDELKKPVYNNEDDNQTVEYLRSTIRSILTSTSS